MTTSISSIVESIEDSQKAQIKLTTVGGNQLSLSCIFKEGDSPEFYLVFPPDTLPDNIDLDEKHPVSIQQDQKIVSLNTRIIEQKGDRTLYLIARETLDPASLREYFRVSLSTPVTASYETSKQGKIVKGWSIKGMTQDLSGSGVLALFKEEPKNKNNIFLEIALPEKNLTIRTLAHIIRKKLLRNRRWQVSFHFDNISNNHRDAIITNLLKEQRKQLREKVNVWD